MIGLLTSFVATYIEDKCEELVKTPFGDVIVYMGKAGKHDVACIQRYGHDMLIPSHDINYRAIIWAYKILGVTRIISQNAIGSINPALRPGDVLVPHDFIDYTKNRPNSLYDGNNCWVRVDMTEPFCPELRSALFRGASVHSERVINRGVWVCFEGPRFETPAEIKMFQILGGDIVGTPLAQEAIFSREAEICYASLAGVINFGAGMAPAVIHTGKGSMVDFYSASGLDRLMDSAIISALDFIPSERQCVCSNALDWAFHGEEPNWLTEYRKKSNR